MISGRTVALALAVVAVAAISEAQVITKKALTLDGAKKIAAAAAAEAKKKNAKVVIAVVDDGGSLILLERLDDTQVASVDVGIGKARTAAIFRRPSKVFEDQIREGRVAALALTGATPLQGGIPILFEGKVIGAIGVSGETPSLDEEIAIAGANALTARAAGSAGTQSSPAVTYIPSDKVKAAFAKGVPLLEVEGYKVHASRRDAPGIAEVHTWEIDVIYVLEGSATFVTGGTLVDPKTTEPGQIRGPSIQGGETRRLAKGDVIIVPNGVPHWFKEVQGPFLYFVVKPISPAGEGK
ncbi:MAG: heme-binding protein [Candidatus Methylomirabilales bacterium]